MRCAAPPRRGERRPPPATRRTASSVWMNSFMAALVAAVSANSAHLGFPSEVLGPVVDFTPSAFRSLAEGGGGGAAASSARVMRRRTMARVSSDRGDKSPGGANGAFVGSARADVVMYDAHAAAVEA